MKKLKSKPLTPELIEQIKTIYAGGPGLQSVRRRTGVSEHVIRRVLLEAGQLRNLKEAQSMLKKPRGPKNNA